MKHNKLLYIILALVLLFLIIFNNKILNLEGLTYIPNINKRTSNVPTYLNLTYAQCLSKCTTSTPKCKGFISDVPNNSNTSRKGECKIYPSTDLDLNINDLKNVKYDQGSYLYII
jgi:hypothetical protein